jgi:hypothetical protein
MTTHFTFEYKRNYGKDQFYPACDNSKFLANLMNVKSLTSSQIKKINDHGWDLEIQSLNLAAVLEKAK